MFSQNVNLTSDQLNVQLGTARTYIQTKQILSAIKIYEDLLKQSEKSQLYALSCEIGLCFADLYLNEIKKGESVLSSNYFFLAKKAYIRAYEDYCKANNTNPHHTVDLAIHMTKVSVHFQPVLFFNKNETGVIFDQPNQGSLDKGKESLSEAKRLAREGDNLITQDPSQAFSLYEKAGEKFKESILLLREHLAAHELADIHSTCAVMLLQQINLTKNEFKICLLSERILLNCRSAIELSDHSYLPHYSLGQYYLLQKNYKFALDYFKAALSPGFDAQESFQENIVKIYEHLKTIYLILGDQWQAGLQSNLAKNRVLMLRFADKVAAEKRLDNGNENQGKKQESNNNNNIQTKPFLLNYVAGCQHFERGDFESAIHSLGLATQDNHNAAFAVYASKIYNVLGQSYVLLDKELMKKVSSASPETLQNQSLAKHAFRIAKEWESKTLNASPTALHQPMSSETAQDISDLRELAATYFSLDRYDDLFEIKVQLAELYLDETWVTGNKKLSDSLDAASLARQAYIECYDTFVCIKFNEPEKAKTFYLELYRLYLGLLHVAPQNPLELEKYKNYKSKISWDALLAYRHQASLFENNGNISYGTDNATAQFYYVKAMELYQIAIELVEEYCEETLKPSSNYASVMGEIYESFIIIL